MLPLGPGEGGPESNPNARCLRGPDSPSEPLLKRLFGHFHSTPDLDADDQKGSRAASLTCQCRTRARTVWAKLIAP
jgi:hypothetical protein